MKQVEVCTLHAEVNSSLFFVLHSFHLVCDVLLRNPLGVILGNI